MAEPYIFLAAWAAATAEGASVLNYYHDAVNVTRATKTKSVNKKDDKNADKVPHSAILLPSALYGVLALPMSILGESPGPALISMIPMAPKHLDVILWSGARAEQTSSKMPEMFPEKGGIGSSDIEDGNDNHSSKSTIRNKNYDLSMIQMARRQNRMIVARTNNLKNSPLPNSSPSPLVWSKFFATLERPNLPTPMAESLRRLRLLLVGTGLITFLAQRYYTSPLPEAPSGESEGTANSTEKMNRIMRLTRSIDCPFDKNTHHAWSRIPERRIPVILNSSTPVQLLPAQHLNLADKQSFADDRLKLLSNNGSEFWLMEADLLVPLCRCFDGTRTLRSSVSSLQDANNLWSSQVNFATDRISSLARQIDPQRRVVAVLVGAGPCHHRIREDDKDNNTTIYIDILPHLADKLRENLEDMLTSTVKDETSEAQHDSSLSTASSSISSSASSSSPPDQEEREEKLDEDAHGHDYDRGRDIFQSIGLWIRKGIQPLLTPFQGYSTNTNVHQPKTRNVHVVTDNHNFVQWLHDNLGELYKLTWIDPQSMQANKQNIIDTLNDDSTFLVCCQNDEDTHEAMHTILLRRRRRRQPPSSQDQHIAKYVNVLALMEHDWKKSASEDIFNDDLTTARNAGTPMETSGFRILSFETIQHDIFQNVQKSLLLDSHTS